jgi:hypothetical protein
VYDFVMPNLGESQVRSSLGTTSESEIYLRMSKKKPVLNRKWNAVMVVQKVNRTEFYL